MTLTTPYSATFITGDGETKTFPYLFDEVSENFITVIVYNALTGITSTPTYIVDTDQKRVIFGDDTPAPTADETICIYRNTPNVQDVPFRTLHGYDAKTLENILSKIVAMIQEIKSNYFTTQVLQGDPWQLDLISSGDDGATVNIDYTAKKLVKGLYFQITNGNLQVSADGSNYITMPKSTDVAEFRQEQTEMPDHTYQYRLQYRVGSTWYYAESNAEATADEALEIAKEARVKSQDAIDTSITALDTANEANDKADRAVADSSQALSVANQANIKSDEAKSIAQEANTKANQAVSTANNADAKADQAIATSQEALADVQSAVEAAETATIAAQQATEAAEAATEAVASKQDKLKAGTGIEITEDNVISSTAQESFFRGRFENWENVPTDSSLYQANFRGETTPSNSDYVVVDNASSYVNPDFSKDPDNIAIRRSPQHQPWGIDITIGETTTHYQYTAFPDWTPLTESGWISMKYIPGAPGHYLVRTNATYYVDNERHNENTETTVMLTNQSLDTVHYVSKNPGVAPISLRGSWNFGYFGTWDEDGKNGWKPQYQVEDVLPVASSTEQGIAKLYTSTGANTDGSMDQNSITTALGGKQNSLPEGTAGQILKKTADGVEWADESGGTVTDVQVDGTSVVSGGVANVVLTGKQDVLSTSDTVIVDGSTLNTNNIVWRKW